jgi:hypothetical protein
VDNSSVNETPGNGAEMFGRIASLEMPPLEYYDTLRYFNDLILREVSDEIGKHAEELGPFITLITFGSDARREKGSVMSPLEIIALANEKDFEGIDMTAVERAIKSVVEKITSTRISHVTEIKTPVSSMMRYKEMRIQPGRIADSRFIHGNKETHGRAKIQLGEEIIAAPSKQIMGDVKNLAKDAAKASETGRNRIAGEDAIHFDLETGAVFYNPKAHRLSFKIGPLRLVQNKILLEEVKYTRDENKPNFIAQLAAGIVPRLKQLEHDRMVNLNRESISDIMEHYAFFLRLYHRSEELYRKDATVQMQLTHQEIEEVAKRLHSLRDLMSAFKIERTPHK